MRRPLPNRKSRMARSPPSGPGCCLAFDDLHLPASLASATIARALPMALETSSASSICARISASSRSISRSVDLGDGLGLRAFPGFMKTLLSAFDVGVLVSSSLGLTQRRARRSGSGPRECCSTTRPRAPLAGTRKNRRCVELRPSVPSTDAPAQKLSGGAVHLVVVAPRTCRVAMSLARLCRGRRLVAARRKLDR